MFVTFSIWMGVYAKFYIQKLKEQGKKGIVFCKEDDKKK